LKPYADARFDPRNDVLAAKMSGNASEYLIVAAVSSKRKTLDGWTRFALMSFSPVALDFDV
jgi:hypothetical protein